MSMSNSTNSSNSTGADSTPTSSDDESSKLKNDENKTSSTSQGRATATTTAVAAAASTKSNKKQQCEFDPDFDVCDVEAVTDADNASWENNLLPEGHLLRYDSLEVILGEPYDASSDIWSTACMAFELATGDTLFEPRSGWNHSLDEDHIAQIIALLGPIPFEIIYSGKFSRFIFNVRGELLHMPELKPRGLKDALFEIYGWKLDDATAFADFLRPMLEFDPDKRATAAHCLEHPWLQTP